MLKPTLLLLLIAAAYAGFECPTDRDNLFGTPCSSNYIACERGRREDKQCGGGEIFDLMRRECTDRERVMFCQDPSAHKDVILEAYAPFSCKSRPWPQDNYGHPDIPCANFFYTCRSRMPIPRECEPGKFYNEPTKHCELKETVAACSRRMTMKINGYVNVPQAEQPGSLVYGEGNIVVSPPEAGAPAPPPQDVPQPVQVDVKPEEQSKLDCVALGDGVYEDKENCVNFFWKCSNGRLFKYECPGGLFYDAEPKRCEKKEFTPKCGGTRPPSTPAPSYDLAPADFDCSGKEDNYYVKNICDSVFYHCNGGVARKMECGDGLQYDIRVHQCEYSDICRAPRTTPAPVPPKPELDVPASTRAPIDFDCAKSGNGLFELGKCKSDYVQCSEGRPTLITCPHDLVLHKNNCDYREICERAMLTPSTTPRPAEDAPIDPYGVPPKMTPRPLPPKPTTPYNGPAPVKTTKAPMAYGGIEQADAPLATPAASCAGLENGVHPLAVCSSEYLSCWEGTGAKQMCPSSLFFNAASSACDYKENVAGCNPGVTLPTAATPARDVPTPAPVIASTPEPVDPFCELLADGFYGFGCNKFFYSCTNGMTHKMMCPGALFYDAEERRCNMKSRIISCGGRPPVRPIRPSLPPPPEISYGGKPIEPVLPPQDAPLPATPAPRLPAFNCTGRKDGIYALPECTADFIQCMAGMAIKNTCQSGLFYNDANGMCDYKERTPTCGGTLPTTPAPTTPAQDPSKVMSCMGKNDGYYALGCSADYYSCVGAVATKLTCAPTLRFSESLRSCDYASHVPECGGTPPTATPPPPARDLSVLPSFSCQGKADGFYPVEACSAYYAVCHLGSATVQPCVDSLFFNAEDGTCAYKENVKGCKPQAPVAPQNTAPSNYASKPANPPAQMTYGETAAMPPAPPPRTPCDGKLSGTAAISDCSAEYLVCRNGAVYSKLQCAAPLIFNPATQGCDVLQRVATCQTAQMPLAYQLRQRYPYRSY